MTELRHVMFALSRSAPATANFQGYNHEAWYARKSGYTWPLVAPCCTYNAVLQFMVAYELLVSMAVNVMFMIDGSEFSVVQVSPQQCLLASLLMSS